MKQVPKSGIQIRNINQALLRNKVNKKEDSQDLDSIFSMVTIIVVLILVTKLQIVHLILEVCN